MWCLAAWAAPDTGSRSSVPFALPPWPGRCHAAPGFFGWLLGTWTVQQLLVLGASMLSCVPGSSPACAPKGLSMGVPRAAAGVSHPNPPQWHPGTARSAEQLGVCTSSSSYIAAEWDLWKLCTWYPSPRSLWYFAAAHTYFVKVCFVYRVYVGWSWDNSV